jgi:hypothetical protein
MEAVYSPETSVDSHRTTRVIFQNRSISKNLEFETYELYYCGVRTALNQTLRPRKQQGNWQTQRNHNLRELLSARGEHMLLNGAAQIEETAVASFLGVPSPLVNIAIWAESCVWSVLWVNSQRCLTPFHRGSRYWSGRRDDRRLREHFLTPELQVSRNNAS